MHTQCKSYTAAVAPVRPTHRRTEKSSRRFLSPFAIRQSTSTIDFQFCHSLFTTRHFNRHSTSTVNTIQLSILSVAIRHSPFVNRYSIHHSILTVDTTHHSTSTVDTIRLSIPSLLSSSINFYRESPAIIPHY